MEQTEALIRINNLVNYNTPEQVDLHELTIEEAEKYLAEGQFGKGSMAPKVQAAINFLRNGGRRVVITSLEKLRDAVDGKAGTVIKKGVAPPVKFLRQSAFIRGGCRVRKWGDPCRRGCIHRREGFLSMWGIARPCSTVVGGC